MAAIQTVGRGLSPDDLTRIRDTLAAGRKPKVVFTAAAGQIAGQVGQVVELTDPAISDEWVVVRFGRDELPFSPGDLAVPTKASPVAAAARPTKTAPSRPATAAVPVPREEPVVPSPTTRKPAASAAKAVIADKAASPGKADASGNGAAPAARADPPPAAAVEEAAPRPARKAAKPKAPPSLTVTVTYTDGDWMVGATQGSRTVAKPYVIKAADALKMVALLDVPAVHEAVEHIVASARAEAEQQADRLRAQLAEVEARLAELRDSS
jgi:hypothetical protein